VLVCESGPAQFPLDDRPKQIPLHPIAHSQGIFRAPRPSGAFTSLAPCRWVSAVSNVSTGSSCSQASNQIGSIIPLLRTESLIATAHLILRLLLRSNHPELPLPVLLSLEAVNSLRSKPDSAPKDITTSYQYGCLVLNCLSDGISVYNHGPDAGDSESPVSG
jgi:hypothetical protein